MQKPDFASIVDSILSANPRFDRNAYMFMRDVLDYMASHERKNRARVKGHVSGQQLLEGVREFALAQFGPMVLTVFEYWGVTRCEDFGVIVYDLIEAGLLSKSETDSIEDFSGAYSFRDAFVKPYLPCSDQASSPGASGASRVRRRESKSA